MKSQKITPMNVQATDNTKFPSDSFSQIFIRPNDATCEQKNAVLANPRSLMPDRHSKAMQYFEVAFPPGVHIVRKYITNQN